MKKTAIRDAVIASLIVGCVTFFISFIATYFFAVPFLSGSNVRQPRGMTLYKMKQLSKDIDAYQKEKNRLPETLNDIIETAYSHNKIDGWYKPFVYQKMGDNFTLISYGADGKRGGNGLDADITLGMKVEDLPPATFGQYFQSNIGWVTGSSIAGIMALTLLAQLLDTSKKKMSHPKEEPEKQERRELIRHAVTVLILSIFVSFFGSLMTMISFATSGH
jgi:hypothetical protein